MCFIGVALVIWRYHEKSAFYMYYNYYNNIKIMEYSWAAQVHCIVFIIIIIIIPLAYSNGFGVVPTLYSMAQNGQLMRHL